MDDVAEQKIGSLSIRINRQGCIGSGNCIKVAGEVFQLDNDGIVTIKPDCGQADREQLLEACRVCPVDALIVIDADGRQLAP